MSIAGAPMDRGDNGRQDDGSAVPSGGAPDDWDKEFTAIVSGITGDMRWEATAQDANSRRDTQTDDNTPPRSISRAPDSIWADATPDTADDRRLRREIRRAERAESLVAFRQAQEELSAARAADTAHYVAPEPPKMPRLKRRTVGALAMIVAGLVLIVFPVLLPASFELIAILGLGLILGGGGILFNGLRRHHNDGGGWNNGSRV
ncbi:MAG: hypothetical protein ABI382_07980 [Nakamurella sp.]